MKEPVSTTARITDVVFSSGWGTEAGVVTGTCTEKLNGFQSMPAKSAGTLAGTATFTDRLLWWLLQLNVNH